MNTPSNAMPESPLDAQTNGSQAITPAVMSVTRPIYWSIRREFWENRYLYIGPLAVAAVFLFAYLIAMIHSPGQVLALVIDSTHHHVSGPFDAAATLMMGLTILMSVFYCAEALHGERRDRSILFWKSLPVSDATTVLVKASIPLLFLPVLVSAVTFVMQLLMLLLSGAVLAGTGGNVATLWQHAPIMQMSLLMLYHVLTAHALWPAPVYCWLLLVSGWARRATFLWAVLPIVAIGGLERIAFDTWHFAIVVGERFIGGSAPVASTPDAFPTDPMIHITPDAFLAAPGLWIGLAIAAIFLAAAIRLRRYQGPI
jgi:ABC-2 type transport system permease protein